MSNIILTTDCQRKCSYCFAKDNDEEPMKFNMSNFKLAVDWLIKDNPLITRVGVLGGEPTTHPDFIKFIDYLLGKQLNTVVFTNGMISDNMHTEIIEVAAKNYVRNTSDFGFCININEEKYRSQKEWELQENFLRNLGRVTTISFNIFEEDADLLFIIGIILKYGTMRNVRLGIAAPLGNKNNFLSLDSFDAVGKKVIAFCKEATRNKIHVGFDCGFTRCMLSSMSEKELQKLSIESWVHDCGPTLDVYPNLDVVSCYPLSRHLRTNIYDSPKSMELYEKWIKELRGYEPIFDKCKDCNFYTEGGCGGGCRSHKINA